MFWDTISLFTTVLRIITDIVGKGIETGIDMLRLMLRLAFASFFITVSTAIVTVVYFFVSFTAVSISCLVENAVKKSYRKVNIYI